MPPDYLLSLSVLKLLRMSEKNTQLSTTQTTSHKLDFTLSSKSHNSDLARLKLLQSASALNATNKQKVLTILTYLSKRIEFNKKLFKETDPLTMKKLFETYEVWKENREEFQKIDQNGFKLVQQQHRVYFGQVKNHKKNGLGVSIYQDGRMYEGQYSENERHGMAIESYPNGNVYNGNFEHNKKHGKGEMYWFSLKGDDLDEYYVGHWWGGLPFGEGQHQRANGDFYQGKFKNGLKHGLGEEAYANGNFYRGEYVNGLAEGNGEYLWSNGDYYMGEFKQGMKSGVGKWRNKDNTQSYEGEYLHDQRCGNGVFYDAQGRVYKGSFLNGNYHGLGEIKQGEEKIYRGFWENGKPATTLNTANPVNTSNTPKTQKTQNPQQNSFKIAKHKSLSKLNQSNRTLNRSISNSHTSRNYQSATRRVGTENSILASVKELGPLRRPKSLVRHNPTYRQRLQTECQESLCGRKYGHKNCVPFFPWQVRGTKMLEKIGRERKLTQL